MKRALLLATAGAAGSAAALVASPATYERLRRLARPGWDDRHLEIQDFPAPPPSEQGPDDARRSLRARVAADLAASPAASPSVPPAADAEADGAAPGDDLRAVVDETRARLREKASLVVGTGEGDATRGR